MSYIKLVRRSAQQKPVVQSVPVIHPAKQELAPPRHYPDGTIIPATLPALYGPAHPPAQAGEVERRCDNCRAYAGITRFCKTWNAQVRPEYVCAVWQATV